MSSATTTVRSKTSSRKHPLRAVKLLLITCFILFFYSLSVQAQDSGTDYDDILRQELILDVRVKSSRFDIPLIAFEENGQFYLPMVNLSELFEFYLETDPENKFLEGWYKEESNSFSLDFANNEIVIKGKREKIEGVPYIEDEFSEPGEFFVAIELLNRIWPVEMSVNMPELTLDVETEEPLPFVERKKRQAKRENALKRLEARLVRKDYPAFPNPYQLYTNPSIHFDSRVEFNEDGYIGNTKISGAQDVLNTTADWSFIIDGSKDQSNQFRDPRLRFRRTSIDEGDLPLGLQDIQAGDVTLLTRDLVSGANRGRGVTFSSMPLFSPDSFDQKTIEGTGPPGWEVELYRNNQILDFQIIGEDGFFIFEDVELVFGNNVFRTVLYGPQGQVRENIERIFVGANMSQPGETRFRLGAIDQNQELLPGDQTGETSIEPSGLAYDAFVTHGINRKLSVFAGTSQIQTSRPGDESEQNFVSGGFVTSLLGGAVQTEFLKDVDGGQALDMRFITNLKYGNINLRSAVFDNFESQASGFDASAKKSDTRAILTTGLPTKLGLLGLKFDAQHIERENDEESTNFSTRQSISYKRIRFSNETFTTLTGGDHAFTQGNFTTTSRIGDYRVRGTLGYDIYPETEFDDIRLEVRHKKPNTDWDAAVILQQNFDTDETSIAAQYTRDYGTFLGSVDSEWDTEDGFSLAFRASLALGAVDKNKYIMSSNPLHTRPIIRSHVFLDRNYDGIFNDGDEPLPNIHLEVNNRRSKNVTDENGYIITDRAQNLRRSAVTIEEKSLVDPYYKSTFEGFSYVPRVGSSPTLPFPIIETGAIDGTVYKENGDPYPGLTLFLIHLDGKLEQETTTAFDGFYTFELIPPGVYTIQPEEGSGLDSIQVTVSSDELFAFGIDFGERKATPLSTSGKTEQNSRVESPEKSEKQPPAASETFTSTGVPAPKTTDGDFKHSVRRVRVGEHATKSRLVLDLSGQIEYTVKTLNDRNHVIIDLPGVSWDALTEWTAVQTPFLAAYRTEALPNNAGTRLILKLRYAAVPNIIGLIKPGPGRPGTSYGYRFVIDFTSTLMQGNVYQPGPTKLAADLNGILDLREAQK